MSELQAVFQALREVDSDIVEAASALHGRAQQLSQAAGVAAVAARNAEGNGAVTLGRVVAAFTAASRNCAQAAALLVASSQEGQSFAARTVGEGQSSSGPAASGPASEGTGGAGGTTAGHPSVDQIESWLGEVNPGYTGDPFDPRSSNCGSCAFAVFQRLSGTSAVAGTGTLTISEMEAATGKSQQAMTPAGIEAALRAAGPGSHAVVGIDRSFGAGHWFNAYFDGDKVVAIDGQSNEVHDWPPNYGSSRNPVTYWDAGI